MYPDLDLSISGTCLSRLVNGNNYIITLETLNMKLVVHLKKEEKHLKTTASDTSARLCHSLSPTLPAWQRGRKYTSQNIMGFTLDAEVYTNR